MKKIFAVLMVASLAVVGCEKTATTTKSGGAKVMVAPGTPSADKAAADKAAKEAADKAKEAAAAKETKPADPKPADPKPDPKDKK